MGLDITVMERKDVRCPHCGEVVNTVDVASTDSGGSLGMTFWKSSATMFLTRSEPRRTTGMVRTWFLTTSRQSSLQTTP